MKNYYYLPSFLLSLFLVALPVTRNAMVEASANFRKGGHHIRGSTRASTTTASSATSLPQQGQRKKTTEDEYFTLAPSPPPSVLADFFVPPEATEAPPTQSIEASPAPEVPVVPDTIEASPSPTVVVPGPTPLPSLSPSEALEELGSFDVAAAAPNAPTISLAPTPVHASCQAAQTGEVYATSTSQTVEIHYELLTLAGSPLSMLTTILDGLFQEYVARSLVDCALAAASDIQGIGTGMQSTFTDANCRRITGFDADQIFCFVMRSSLEVYLSDTSSLTTQEIQDAVWQTLRDAINGPPSKKRQRRVLNKDELFMSQFVDPDTGIVDIYFLDQPSSSVSQANNQAHNGQSSNGGDGMSRAASASLMGFTFLIFGIIGLVFRRKNHHDPQQDRADSMVKTTVIANGNTSYQSEFHRHHNGSPRVRQNRRSEFEEYEVENDGGSPPSSPSQLSFPTDGSISDTIPSASLFEAYEATPAEDGGNDHVVHSYGSKPRSGRSLQRSSSRNRRSTPVMRTVEVPPLDQSDELLDQPPPFMSRIPRSARSRPSSRTSSGRSTRKSSQSPRNQQQESGGDRKDHLEKSVARVISSNAKKNNNHRMHHHPDPNATGQEERRPTSKPADDWEVQNFTNKPVTTGGDSFSMTGFLNGHCAAMEEFHRSEIEKYGTQKKQQQQQVRTKSNISPTSVCDPIFTDTHKTPQISNKQTHVSSVKLWTSTCDNSSTDSEEDDDAGVENENGAWKAWNYINQNFSPYSGGGAHDNHGEPYLGFICGPTRVEASPDRGRSPTPIDDATNAHRRRSQTPSRSRTTTSTTSSRSTTPSRTPRNPPGHRIKTYSHAELSAFQTLRASSSSSSQLWSSSQRPPSPGYRTSRRGSSNYPAFAPDTVQF